MVRTLSVISCVLASGLAFANDYDCTVYNSSGLSNGPTFTVLNAIVSADGKPHMFPNVSDSSGKSGVQITLAKDAVAKTHRLHGVFVLAPDSSKTYRLTDADVQAIRATSVVGYPIEGAYWDGPSRGYVLHAFCKPVVAHETR